MAKNKKLVLSPEQTDQAILTKAKNNLRMTDDEKRRYNEIINRPDAAPRSVAMYNTVNAGTKQAAINEAQQIAAGKQASQNAAQEYARQQAAKSNAVATNASVAQTDAKKTALNEAQQIAAGRQASQNAAQEYARQQTAKLEPKPEEAVSEYDKWLSEWYRHRKNYLFYRNANPEIADNEYTLMSRIAQQAQEAGVYAYAKKLANVGETSTMTKYAPLFYATYDDYTKAAGDTSLDRASFEMRGGNTLPAAVASSPAADIYNTDRLLSGKAAIGVNLGNNPEAAANAVLEALKASGIATEDFNNEYDSLRLPDNYDYSNGNVKINKVLQAMSKEADEATNIATTLVNRVPTAFKNNGTQWQGTFLYCFYKNVPEYIGLSEEDAAYAAAMVDKYSGYAQYLNIDYVKPSSKKTLKKQASKVTSEASNGTDEVLQRRQ